METSTTKKRLLVLGALVLLFVAGKYAFGQTPGSSYDNCSPLGATGGGAPDGGGCLPPSGRSVEIGSVNASLDANQNNLTLTLSGSVGYDRHWCEITEVPDPSFVGEGDLPTVSSVTITSGPGSLSGQTIPSSYSGGEEGFCAQNELIDVGEGHDFSANGSFSVASLANGSYSGTIRVTNSFNQTDTANYSFVINRPVVTYTLNVSKSPSAGGTVTGSGINCGSDCSEVHNSGTVVNITASENPNYTFNGWSGACSYVGTSKTCQLTMTASRTTTALFSEIVNPDPVTTILGVCGSAQGSYTCGQDSFRTPFCLSGTANPVNQTFPGAGGNVTWVCEGNRDDLTTDDVTCAATRASTGCGSAPVCGSANGKTYLYTDSSFGSDTFCGGGGSVSPTPTFPAPGGTTNWSCTASGATPASCSASRQNTPPATSGPWCSLGTFPTNSIESGESTYVGWTTGNGATTLSISPTIGSVSVNDSNPWRLVSPAVTTTYTGTVSNGSQTNTCSVTVAVGEPAGPTGAACYPTVRLFGNNSSADLTIPQGTTVDLNNAVMALAGEGCDWVPGRSYYINANGTGGYEHQVSGNGAFGSSPVIIRSVDDCIPQLNLDGTQVYRATDCRDANEDNVYEPFLYTYNTAGSYAAQAFVYWTGTDNELYQSNIDILNVTVNPPSTAPVVDLDGRDNNGSPTYTDGPLEVVTNPAINQGSVGLQWTVSNATSCVGNATPTQTNWASTSKSTSGGTDTRGTTLDRIYTVTCSNANGSTQDAFQMYQAGAIQIVAVDQNNNPVQATWDLVGPENASQSAPSSGVTYASQRLGTYTLLTENVSGYAANPTVSVVLGDGTNSSNSTQSLTVVTTPIVYTITYTAFECNDGVDNTDSEDTLADLADPDCDDPDDPDERRTGRPQCSDGVDNDGDDLTDSADPGCHTDGNPNNEATYDPNDNDEQNEGTTQCGDGVDNDGDGYTDYPLDDDCTDSGGNNEAGDPQFEEF